MDIAVLSSYRGGPLPKGGDILFFCRRPPSDEALAALRRVFADPGVAAVVPRDLEQETTPWHNPRTGTAYYASFRGFAVRRTAFTAVGGLAKSADDMALTTLVWQLRDAGLRTVYRPEVTVGTAEIPIRALGRAAISFGEKVRQIAHKAARKLLTIGAVRRAYYDRPRRSAPRVAAMLRWIEEKKQSGTVAAVMAPHPADETLSKGEGYMRRVEAVDREILADATRIYFYESTYHHVDEVTCRTMADGALYVHYNTAYADHRAQILRLVAHCDAVYVHSLLRTLATAAPGDEGRALDVFSRPGPLRLFDVHGAVPEEFEVQGSHALVPAARRAERRCVRGADVVIGLTASMNRHLADQHGSPQQRTEWVELPMFSDDIGSADIPPKPGDGVVVVYAGGCQSWQNIPLIQRAVRARANGEQFRLFITQPDVFYALWGEESLPDYVQFGTRTVLQLAQEYERCHYGFLLRDDTTLNRVACPTKLIEYLKYGIVPILCSPAIGDFEAMGLSYVPYHDYLAGRLPREDDRAAMVARNAVLLGALERQYEKGRDTLRRRIDEAGRRRGCE
jgi:hypothetical protein